MVAPVLRRSRRREGGRLAAAAAGYAARGWPVCQGAYPPGNAKTTGRACSCDRVGCPAPAAHPMSPAWQLQASCDRGEISQRWAHHPAANVVLPTGRVFDVLDVRDADGPSALNAMRRCRTRRAITRTKKFTPTAGSSTIDCIVCRSTGLGRGSNRG